MAKACFEKAAHSKLHDYSIFIYSLSHSYSFIWETFAFLLLSNLEFKKKKKENPV